MCNVRLVFLFSLHYDFQHCHCMFQFGHDVPNVTVYKQTQLTNINVSKIILNSTIVNIK